MLDRDQLTKQLARAKAVLAFALKSEAAPRIHAAIDLARSEPGVPLLPDDMDRDPWLLNCLNGTLELKTGRFRGHRREDYLTKLCPVAYDAAAACPVWLRFLSEIFPATGDAAETAGDEELIGFVQRFLGYCLSGDVGEQILPIFWGTGANGKSTLLGAVLEMLGLDYAMKATGELLMVKGDSHPTERADLFGKRLVVCNETEEGRRLAEALVKDLTGGDRIRARRMREDFWEFAPTHKIILCTNHKPKIRGTDHAIWRRVRLVPFTSTIAADKQDKRLPEKLRAELPGILAWCVRGCLLWQRDGLGLPAVVRAATEGYRSEQDLVASFLADQCVVGPDYRCRASEIHAAFVAWCKSTGEADGAAVPTQRIFGEALTERGYERYKNNGTWYRGLALRQNEPED